MNKTNISYLDYTWNPVTGCSPAGPGCDNCWARRVAETRLLGRCGYPADDPFRVTWHPGRLLEPAKTRKPARIGVCFMGDLFHYDVKDEWIDQVLEITHIGIQHKFFFLTKRPSRLTSYFSKCFEHEVFPNVWIGVSVWDQRSLERSINNLMNVPNVNRWISYEPALGPIDISMFVGDKKSAKIRNCYVGPEFIVAGGETGPGARPAHPGWFRRVRDDCAAAGVVYHHKQNGEWMPCLQASDGTSSFEVVLGTKEVTKIGDTWMQRVGSKRAGRLLDGKLHDEVPE